MTLQIRKLKTDDAQRIALAFAAAGLNKGVEQYVRYAEEQSRGERDVFVAEDGTDIVGYATVVWRPEYAAFAGSGIPEIQDVNVLPGWRRRGVATALMDRAESAVGQRSRVVGIGVGLDADYGPAQRLYVLRGYVPDGNGLIYANEPVAYGQQVRVDDDLTLRLTKSLPSTAPPN